MRYVVDRIEENFAVCEDDNKIMHNIPIGKLPKGVKEGMELNYISGQYFISEPQTDKLQQRMNRLWK